MGMTYEEACNDGWLDYYLDELREELEDMDYGEALNAHGVFKDNPREGFDQWWSRQCRDLELTDYELDKEIPDHFDHSAIEAVYLDRLEKSPQEKNHYEMDRDLNRQPGNPRQGKPKA